MPTSPEKYKKMYLTEAREHLENLNNALLKLEKKFSVKSANELMRAAHTLKSMSAAMNFNNISTLCHAMEDLFDGARTGKLKLKPETISFLFTCFDTISASLDAIKKGDVERGTTNLIDHIRNLLAKGRGRKAKEEIVEQLEGAELAERPEEFRPIEEIKVDITTLDNLMNLAEELLVNKMRFSQINETKNYEDLEPASDALGRLVSDLQFNVTQARMVPIGQIFDRFPRMVRDLATKQGKVVELHVEGSDIELDRTIIDRIAEPLVHLLRNAVDHGVGKKGNIWLAAEREKGYVIIEVINDGRSIDLRAVTEAAVKRDIIGAREAEALLAKKDKQKIFDLLYHPQLSTSKKVTETSGRGVGLNVVKTRIESLGGTVTLESPLAEGKEGVKVVLRLPLTLAIIQALLFKVAGGIYAVPLANIDRLVSVLVKDVKQVLDTEVAVVGGQDVPLISLSKLFSTSYFDLLESMRYRAGHRLEEPQSSERVRTKEKKETGQGEAETIIIVRKGGPEEAMGEEETKDAIAGLVVDELMSSQEIVIKPLTGILRQNKGFAGVTILGDGKPALILDIATLI